MTSGSRTLQQDLIRWSESNALALTAIAALTSTGRFPLWLLSASGVLSFSMLLYCGRHRWTPLGRFGPANSITAARLAGVFVLPFLPPAQVALVGAVLLALDGIDGKIARRSGLSGEFGEFFDKESDAFFMLALCLMLYRMPEGFGAWILVPGLMRYLFVLFVKVAKPPLLKEHRRSKAAWIFVLMMLTLLLCFVAYPRFLDYARPLAALMSLVLAFSFAQSLYLMYRTEQQTPGT